MTKATPADDSALLELIEKALDMDPAERESWLNAHCPSEQRARAGELLALAQQPTRSGQDNLARFVHTDRPREAGSRVGAYELIELIGEGGMGQVYLAERADGAFDARVAVKIIRASMLGSVARTQFERERQILSDLRHPGIANMLDGGTTEDGLPFVVMELVEGQSLGEYLADNTLSLDAKLALFQQICAAVEHAHRALVIHRDIKPSNVLVTNDGKTKLLDFGIARTLDTGAGEQTVAMVLTPAYASPEQVTHAPLTTATDVYSLGVVLYEMLSGDRPFETTDLTPAQYEELITQRRPDPPSLRARKGGQRSWQRVAGELDAIVLKAMAKEPERRYDSVRELRDDLQRFSSGYPVHARGDSVGYRLGKFLRRRWVPVTIGLATFAALGFAYATTLAQYRAAERERQRADARFNQARELAREVLYDVYDQMSGVQGTLPAREALAETGVRFLDELATDPGAPEDLLLDIGSHYSRLYDLYAGLGIASLGQTEKALEQLNKSEAALKRLLEQYPENIEAVTEMVWVKRLAANHALSYDLGTDVAEAHAREGLALADAAMANSNDPHWALQSHRWNIRIDLVKVLIWAQDFDQAFELLDLYLPDLVLPGWKENLKGWERKRVYAYSMRGEAHMDAGNSQKAIPDFEVALAYYQDQATAQPDSAQVQTQLLRMHHNLSNLHTTLKDWPLALKHAEAGRAAALVLVDKDPRDMPSRRNLALHDQQIGKIKSRLGDHDEAQASINRTLTTFRTLSAEDAGNAGLVRDLAIALTDAGDIVAAANATRDGCADYRAAQRLWDQLESTGDISAYTRKNGLQATQKRLEANCD
jgi:tetratricopeptide (TPR) repeat protein/tRNA A-37 threonylcarbamoyl transferase component Bud32